MTQTTFTAYEDDAGGTHISDGTSAWFLGFDYNQGQLSEDIAAWAAGDWEPNEGDGQTPESIEEYKSLERSTDCTPLAKMVR